jgi:hypothetical protein
MKVFKLSVLDEMALDEQSQQDGASGDGFNRYISMRGFVIVATSEASARELATNAQDGGPWWLDAKQTACEEVNVAGLERVILANEPTG